MSKEVSREIGPRKEVGCFISFLKKKTTFFSKINSLRENAPPLFEHMKKGKIIGTRIIILKLRLIISQILLINPTCCLTINHGDSMYGPPC
ncbi:MAG: hypothetical protein Ct9H300mP2_1570 [Candidatus Neomarinimicrobiota bacterium]|nr:MAG: hypothetical protein Ct9H300mP2_1570 [Candidatus Neomarinimicrobiota bacterium]